MQAETEDDPGMDEELSVIRKAEMEQAITEMKIGKSPGDESLPVENFLAGGTCVVQQMFIICNTAYLTEMAPVASQRGLIRPIYKKGEKHVCDNYRGIALLAHSGKIYTKILEKRLRVCVEEVLDPCQYGFRPDMGTTDASFVDKMLLEESWEWGINKYTLFIDFEKHSTE